MDEKKPEGKVISIEDKKKEKAEAEHKKESGKAPARKRVGNDEYLAIFGAFTRNKSSGLPPFGEHFTFVEYDDGSRIPFKVVDRTVLVPVVPTAVAEAILRYAQAELGYLNLSFMPRHATDCYNLIKGLAEPIPYSVIEPIAEKDSSKYCWHKLPFNVTDGECPVFHELVGRTSSDELIKAFIGSLFFKDSDRRQYLWVYGSGRNGKSRLARLMKRILGPAYKTENVPDRSSQRFWTTGIVNKRLVVFDDCNNYGFPGGGFFKGLTGSDDVRIERKGQDSYDTELVCRFLFLSNEAPSIKFNTAEMTRAMYVEIQPVKGRILPTKQYDDMLWQEAPAIIAECKRVYLEQCPDHNPIPTEAIDDVILDIIDNTEEAMIQNVENQWEIDIDQTEWFVTPNEFMEWCSVKRFSAHDIKEVRAFLMNRHGIKHAIKKIDGKVQRIYKGMRSKTVENRF